jgi:hypothetical protein
VTLRAGEPVPWEHLDEPVFSRLIDALIQEHHHEDTVEVVDGRGGDGGVDAWVRRKGRTVVYQYKRYPEGFDGRWNDRRRKIRDSLTRVISAERPDEWVLVYPGKPTRSGWAFIRKLQHEHPDVVIRVWDRSMLDSLCARYPSVVNAVARKEDYFLREMKALNAETAVVAETKDLLARVGKLGSLAQDVDERWRVDFSYENGIRTVALVPRHLGSGVQDPISVHPILNFERAPGDLVAELERFIDYGAGERIRIPGEVITRLDVRGPAWFTPPSRPDWFEIEKVLPKSQSIRLELEDAAGKHIGRHVGPMVDVGQGKKGLSVKVNLYDHLDVQFLLPRDTREQVRASLLIDLDQAAPGDALRSLRALAQLRSAHRVRINAGTSLPLGTVVLEAPLEEAGESDTELVEMEETARDLAFIEEELSVPLRWSGDVSVVQRVHARILAQLLSGLCTLDLGPASVEVTFEYWPSDPRLDSFLRGEPGGLRLGQGRVEWPLLGETVPIDLLAMWHPRMRLDLGSDARPVVGQRYRIVADDDTPFRLYLPDRVGARQRLKPVGWGLTGVNDPETVPGS